MIKVFKWILGILFLLVFFGIIAGVIVHEKRPESNPSSEADSVARVMLEAVNKSHWDSTRYVSWTLMGIHDYVWDKFENNVEVRWSDIRVILNTKSVKGVVFEDGQKISGQRTEDLVQRAWAYFINDSFWLNAPATIFNSGTERSIVELEDGRQALLVEFTSGGVTPGDAYAWLLDNKGLPQSWKMWVSIIPVGGLEVSWEKWVKVTGGAKIATLHKLGPLSLEVTHLKAGDTLSDMDLNEDPFIPLEDIIDLDNSRY